MAANFPQHMAGQPGNGMMMPQQQPPPPHLQQQPQQQQQLNKVRDYIVAALQRNSTNQQPWHQGVDPNVRANTIWQM